MRPLEPEALDEGRTERLAGELARAVERDGQVPEVHLAAGLGRVAVHGAAGREDEALRAGQTRGLERVVRRDGALLEVEARPLEAPARLRVGGEVEDDVVTLRWPRSSGVEVERVPLDERRPAGLEAAPR